MKIYVRKPIFCGISGEKDNSGEYKFTVDFDQNTKNDAVQFIEPYYEEKEINGAKICWFGYRYNNKVPSEYRKACSLYLENVQGTPEILDDETEELYIYLKAMEVTA